AAGEADDLPPGHRSDVEPLAGVVEGDGEAAEPVVQVDGEAAVHRDDQLLQAPVPVRAAQRVLGDVVEVVDPADLEGQVPPALDHRQAAPRIGEGLQVDGAGRTDPGLGHGHPAPPGAA